MTHLENPYAFDLNKYILYYFSRRFFLNVRYLLIYVTYIYILCYYAPRSLAC